MRNLFLLLARYNAHANEKMFEILEKAPAELLTRSVGSYFDSVMGLLNHALVSDLGWLGGYHRSEPAFRSLEAPALDFQNPGWRKPLYDSLPDLRKRRREVDEVFSRFAEELTDERLAGDIVMTSPRGEKHTFVLSQVLLHLFNHQTHHRGQISQILDAEGIENDFSNILSLLRPS